LKLQQDTLSTASAQSNYVSMNRPNIKTNYEFRKTMVPHILRRLESGTQSWRPPVESLSRKKVHVYAKCARPSKQETADCTAGQSPQVQVMLIVALLDHASMTGSCGL
jgi:hypothetical protein